MKIRFYIEKTLLELLKTKTIDKIFVSDIISEVGVCKGTFYKYYIDKYDLLNKTFENFFYADIEKDVGDGETILSRFIKIVRENSLVFEHALCSEDPNSLFNFNVENTKKCIRDNMKNAGKDLSGEPYYERVVDIYARCIMGIISDWLKNGCRESDDELIGLIHVVVPDMLRV